MPVGVLLALLSYSLYAIGDSITKSFGSETLSPFEINFFISLFALVALPLARGPNERWRDIFRFRRPWLMHVRALLYTGATLCFTFAVTRIPFAETYALTFLTPLFLTLLSAVILRERVGLVSALLVGASFIGVLIVVRPGFHELGPGHIAALCCAVLVAGGNIVLRLIAVGERQIGIIALAAIYQLAVTGLLMLGHFAPPSLNELTRLALVGALGGLAQLLLIGAMRRSLASHVGPTQYVQLIWAIALGALFYGETQDTIGYAGLALIVLAGIATFFADAAEAKRGKG